jgi:8-amino-7-oxononanoate synthase
MFMEIFMDSKTNPNIKEKIDMINLLKENDLYTYCLEVSSECGNFITVNGKKCINFISNNYLGFSTHPKVKEAVAAALNKYGLGIGGSPIACGTTELHNKLMERKSNVYNKDACVLFASGYQAMLGSIQAAVIKGDVVLLDALVHRSIVDGVILSGADKRMWIHNDTEDLAELLEKLAKKYKRMMVVVDSVYSMDGDIADLPELRRLCEKYGAHLLIDEAHSLGVLGKKGYGLLEHFGLPGGTDIISGTFSKFAGAIGGFTTGSKDYIDFVQHTASPFVFSASLSPLIVAGVLKSFDLLIEEPEWRERLWKNVKFFQDGLKSIGFDIGSTRTPVVPIMIRDVEKTLRFNKMILDNGVFASPIIAPGVPPAESRIRLGVIATHTQDDLEKSIEVFKNAGKELGII